MPRRGENIRKRKDGRWEGRFIKTYDAFGKAKYSSVYGSTYLDVKKKLNGIVEHVPKNSFYMQKYDLTFREILFLWLQGNRVKLKDQTYAKYFYLIENHILPLLGQLKVEKLNVGIINQFIYWKSHYGRLDGKGGLSPSYIKTICFILSSALNFAVKEGYRSLGIGEITRPVDKSDKRELKILTRKEQGVLERHLIDNLDERKLGVLLSLRMGLRVGEVCGLRWEDIDMTDKTVHIRHTVERITNISPNTDANKTRLALCETKTVFSNRIIPIPSGIMPLIVHYKKSSGFVLPGNTYDYTDPRTFQNAFHRYLKECNIRSLNYHCLRHTFATRCIEAGMDIKSLSELLGHSSVNITLNIYVHSSIEHKRNQLELVPSICGQN